MIAILLAVPDLEGEAELVAQAPAAGLRVVRRCVDAVDLFAAAAADVTPAIVLSAGLPRLERDAVERMAQARTVVGLATSAADEERLRRLGLTIVLQVSGTCAATLGAVRAVLADEEVTGVWSTGVWPGGPSSAPTSSGEPEPPPRPGTVMGSRQGRVIAVWGPTGAPGRTTMALGLAEALAEAGNSVGLVDADTYGPSVAMALGLIDDASGLSVACRHADNGTLTTTTLQAAGHRLTSRWSVIGGISRPDRWSDLRPSALDQVWARCRESFDVTVVDTGFCLEGDDGGAWASRRNSAAVTAMAGADHVFAVADSTALGAARLIASWPAVAAAAPMAEVRVLQNRSHSRFKERSTRWLDGVRELGIAAPVHPVPLDPRAVERCWTSGRSFGERARHSPLRHALRAVADMAVSR